MAKKQKSGGGELKALVHPMPVSVHGPSALDRLTGLSLSDLANHYAEHGRNIWPMLYETNPLAYANIIVQLSKIVRVDIRADVHHSVSKPQSIDEILDRVERETGKEGRVAFAQFLKKVKPST